MKYLPYLVVIFVFVNSFVACSKQDDEVSKTPNVQEVIVIDDGYNLNENGEIIIDDQDVGGRTLVTAKEQSEESTKTNPDGSQIKIMKDGYGNKTISRFFYEHPLIAGIVTRISAKGGSNTFVYTKDGLVKKVVNGLSNLVESGSANEIAKELGITSLNNSESYRPMMAKAKQSNNDLQSFDEFEPVDNNNQPTKVAEFQTAVENKPLNEELTMEKFKPDNPVRTVANNTFLNEFESKIEKTSKATKKKVKN